MGYNQSNKGETKMSDKPKRLEKLEQYWREQHREVEFFEADESYWHVLIRGYFADYELHEIVKALKAANKAGVL
jgi:hypothetical protein